MDRAHCPLDRCGFPSLEKWVDACPLLARGPTVIEYALELLIDGDAEEEARDVVGDGEERHEGDASMAVVQGFIGHPPLFRHIAFSHVLALFVPRRDAFEIGDQK